MRKKYSEAFIEQAVVKLLSRDRRTVREVALVLNVIYHMAKNWMKRESSDNAGMSPGQENRPEDWIARDIEAARHMGFYAFFAPVTRDDGGADAQLAGDRARVPGHALFGHAVGGQCHQTRHVNRLNQSLSSRDCFAGQAHDLAGLRATGHSHGRGRAGSRNG